MYSSRFNERNIHVALEPTRTVILVETGFKDSLNSISIVIPKLNLIDDTFLDISYLFHYVL